MCRKRLSSPRCRSELIDSAWVVIVPGQKCINKNPDILALVKLLEQLADNAESSPDSRSKAKNLLSNILNFNFLTFLLFW